MRSAKALGTRSASWAGLAVAAVAAPLFLAGCSSDSTSTASSSSEAATTSVSAPTMADTDGCSAKPKQPDELYGKQWLDAYKSDPSSGVTLRRCHYDQTAKDQVNLVPPSSVITDDAEVQKIILELPDSTDPGHRCGPGGDYLFVYQFDEYTVIDQSGTPRADFQISKNSPCGIDHVVPSA